MVLGMCTEVGELQDIFKRSLVYNENIDWVNVKEEIGDLMYYIASFCRINGIDLEKILEKNVEKLESRYHDKFSEKDALERNLNKERQILEK